MADLYVSFLGRPFRAAITYAGGRRALVRIGDRRDDEYGLDPDIWIDREGSVAGAQASYFFRAGQDGAYFKIDPAQLDARGDDGEWTARDLIAIALRRFLTAAETQAGEPLGRLVTVLPPGGGAMANLCRQAALLAGAQEVGVTVLDDILASPAAASVEAFVEAWDDIARITVAAPGAAPVTVPLAAQATPAALRALLASAYRLGPEFDGDLSASIAHELFDRWNAGSVQHGVAVARPSTRGDAISVFVPAATFAALDAVLVKTLRDAFAECGLAPETCGAVRVAGTWSRPLSRALASLAPTAAIRDERGVEFDLVVERVARDVAAPRAALRGDLLAVAQNARTLRGIAQGAPFALLAAGTRLPATAVFEDFASSQFIEAFWVALREGPDQTPLPMLRFAIPRYAERQTSSYFRTVVHSESDDLVFLECAYLYPSRRRFAFYDRRAGTEIPISERAFRIVRGA